MAKGARQTGGGGDLAAGSGSGPRPDGVRKLGAGREFDLIRSFFPSGVEPRDDVRVGAGDDAAVVLGEGIVLSTDLSVEGIHFRRDWLTPAEVGYRAAMAALSDLAAMAARPIGVLVSLGVERAEAEAVAAELMSGVRAAASEVGGALLGGDLTGSPGPMIVDVTVVGEAARPILRSGAVEGDELWVTGRLGASGLAVRELIAGRDTAPAALERYRRPKARTAEALWIADRGLAHAMLDLSDGLGGDAGHLARASGVAVVLEESAIPAHECLHAAGSLADALRLALSGGEDYELLFAARPGTVEPHRGAFQAAFDCALTAVGTVRRGEGVHLRTLAGDVVPLAEGGFQHFPTTG